MLHALVFVFYWLLHWIHGVGLIIVAGLVNAVLWCFSELPPVMFDHIIERLIERLRW